MREEVERIAPRPEDAAQQHPRRRAAAESLGPTRAKELLGMVEGAYRVLDLVNLSIDIYRMEQGAYGSARAWST